ncbi:hypothetical protein BDY19DRAFT_769437 [Irpex rosettiformis]|uniref:Uncharacterized protein n=1 Tax=Irpex rosettiformis TaxID=378272 RepID=A0ACB8U7T4_9APHY|nr:hypothetical protein BDY19DRAFT_769437 [Irpex rosettiformis]
MVAVSGLIKTLFASSAAKYTQEIDRLAAFGGLVGCDISSSGNRIDLGPINNAFQANFTPTFVGLAFGTQNYTCTKANNFTNVGAVAQLFDVSCLVNASFFNEVQIPLFNAWNTFPMLTIQDFINFFHESNPPEVLAQHYFVPNPVTGQGLSPKWDFRSSGNPKFVGADQAVFVGQGVGNVPAPNRTTDIAWLNVANIGRDKGGQIADQVLRTNTIGGQPPSTCTFGQSPDIVVKYSSFYWFFGGKLGGPSNVTHS